MSSTPNTAVSDFVGAPSDMALPGEPAASNENAVPAEKKAARKQIRGSSLLFAGRLMSQLITLAVHTLIVRYLPSKSFGAYMYALSVTQSIGLFSTLGFDRAVSRFVPIYHERNEFGKMFGTLKLVILTIVGFGLFVPAVVLAFHGTIEARWVQDPEVMTLLMIAVFLVPFEAFDALLINMFAVFASPKAIFFRRHLLAPVMRLSIVGLMILMSGDARFLTFGAVASSAFGVAICSVVLYRLMTKEGVWKHFDRNNVDIPWREILVFTLPLLSTDILFLVMNGLDVVLLKYYGTLEDVAAYRAVQPFARLNLIVYTTFTVLFTPQASRFFARSDKAGINELYWKTATWIAVLTFPVFIASFSLGQPLTLFMFGEQYAESGKLLSILAVGYYINAALGFNGTTLTIYRMVWYVALSTFVVAALNLAINFTLIPRYGAMGAAVGTSVTLIAHNLLKQSGLLFGTGVSFADRRYLRVYAIIASSAVGLWLIQQFANFNIFASSILGVVIILIVVRTNRAALDVTETFPELLRVPLIPLLLGKPRSASARKPRG
ncbi:MAG: flippase [Planctomycetaceae bacterium]